MTPEREEIVETCRKTLVSEAGLDTDLAWRIAGIMYGTLEPRLRKAFAEELAERWVEEKSARDAGLWISRFDEGYLAGVEACEEQVRKVG